METSSFTTENYWSERYRGNDIPWDTGGITTPIKEYIDHLHDRGLRLLIPGAGSGYEAEYCMQQGFENTFVIDISAEALQRLQDRCPEFPEEKLIHGDFFSYTGEFDLILEQTFFCALPPVLRSSYVAKMHELLVPGGHLAGVLFDDPLYDDHPPFGGNESVYRSYFFPTFEEKIMARCYNSIAPRRNRELFIELRKRKIIGGSTT
ncbi:methyltransferase domain-containing protein [Fulvivirga sedimenti]|uniref:TPMT family class I SAM-dependent methyltransferase n=1 Tax=Fulvivirga sedimenti TaxID=2879465 RepID=A0A9X1HLQ9_9BACT|nr:methyltransferase domain-containing protein [Fulvivirga sedimenti]MCA6073646.1 TPMT family class I SAM-dependent methyltransferase [Fulvivirga sedimenti]